MPSQTKGEFPELTARFAEFCETYGRMAAEHGEPALCMSAALAQWVGRMTAAQEAAARAPETDRLLVFAWSDRLVDIVEDARRLLATSDGMSTVPGSPVSIDHHETGIPLPRISKPAPQPVAGPVGRRASHPRRRRR